MGFMAGVVLNRRGLIEPPACGVQVLRLCGNEKVGNKMMVLPWRKSRSPKCQRHRRGAGAQALYIIPIGQGAIRVNEINQKPLRLAFLSPGAMSAVRSKWTCGLMV